MSLYSLITDMWDSRDWAKFQKPFRKRGTRYYGDGGTYHQTNHLNVEVYKGEVIAVWFRCQRLPFTQAVATDDRAIEMIRSYIENPVVELCGIEVKDANN